MRKITKKTAVIVAGSTLLVAVGGGIAFAYWSSTGTGTGSATASTGSAGLTISQPTAPNDLAPGVAPEALTGTITNGGTSSAHVNSLTVTITSVSGGLAGCTIQDFGLTTGTPGTAGLTKGSSAPQTITVPVGQEVAAGSSVAFPSVNIGFANDLGANQDACKSASPQLSYATN